MNTRKRITEATIRLVLRQGYDKTTIQDIAREAGLARGTIYTKWQTKADLFAAILWSESMRYLDTWYSLVERDPDGGSLHGIYRNALLALRQNPFILALYTQNRLVVGSFVHEESFAESMNGMVLWNVRWMNLLQEHGLIRHDIDVEATAWIEVIFRQGLLTMPLDLEAHPHLDYETILDLFFTMVGNFVGTHTTLTADAGKVVLKEYIDAFKAQMPSTD
ncbi:MAG: TetR/AcrR family transcriptional regulator [Chloroflexota bacterium]